MPPKKGEKPRATSPTISLTKLHRILRPLRSKCVALAETLNQPSVRHAITGSTVTTSRLIRDETSFDFPNISSSSPASHFHRSPHPAIGIPTLHDDDAYVPFGHVAYLPTSNTIGGGHRLGDSMNRINAEIGVGIAYARLGDKVAAVVTAFEGVVKNIHPTLPPPTSQHSLRSMCGAVVGQQIEPLGENDLSDDESDDSEEGDENEEDEDEDEEESEMAVDQWYEAIPDHLRRFVVIGHAVDMIEKILPMSLPRLWEDLLDCCAKNASSIEVQMVLSKLLACALSSAPKPMPTTEKKFPPSYLLKLSQRLFGSIPSLDPLFFIDSVLRAVGESDPRLSWSHPPLLSFAENHPCAPLIASRILDSLLANPDKPKQNTRMRKWTKLLLRLDFSLPPDEDMEDGEAVRWVEALAKTAIQVLDICTELESWRSAGLCLGLHAYVRSEDYPGLRATLLERLLVLSNKVFVDGRIATKAGALPPKDIFAIMLPCLEKQYFFDAVSEYASALWATEKLHAMEAMFLSSALSFAKRCSAPSPYDEDLDPLLDDHQMDEVRKWYARALDKCRRQRSLSSYATNNSVPDVRSASGSPSKHLKVNRPPPQISTNKSSTQIPKNIPRKQVFVELIVRPKHTTMPSTSSGIDPRRKRPFLPDLIARTSSVSTPSTSERSTPFTDVVTIDSSSSDDEEVPISRKGPRRSPKERVYKTSSTNVSYAQPPSWVTDPQTIEDAKRAALASSYRASAARNEAIYDEESDSNDGSPGLVESSDDTDDEPVDHRHEAQDVDLTPLAARARQRGRTSSGLSAASSSSSSLCLPSLSRRTTSTVYSESSRQSSFSSITSYSSSHQSQPFPYLYQQGVGSYPSQSQSQSHSRPQYNPAYTRHNHKPVPPSSEPGPLNLFNPAPKRPRPSAEPHIMNLTPRSERDPLDLFSSPLAPVLARPAKKRRLGRE
ncbi:hypothetical protein DL93DRAFT_1707600 [Clavulina sp. PMI_390]|nr:hypothetical protein DL93DRAFT_1707600 [Clavulina sp. PMI_390]